MNASLVSKWSKLAVGITFTTLDKKSFLSLVLCGTISLLTFSLCYSNTFFFFFFLHGINNQRAVEMRLRTLLPYSSVLTRVLTRPVLGYPEVSEGLVMIILKCYNIISRLRERQ